MDYVGTWTLWVFRFGLTSQRLTCGPKGSLVPKDKVYGRFCLFKWGGLVVSILVMRALLFAVYI